MPFFNRSRATPQNISQWVATRALLHANNLRCAWQVLRDFDGRLRGFQENALRGGGLSFSTKAFAEAFGADVARFFEAIAGDQEKSLLLDDVLAGSCMLRKHFFYAPQGAERVVMEVVSRFSACGFVE